MSGTMATVGQVMKPAPKWLPASTTLLESANLFVGLRVRSLPVCTDDGRLTGLLTSWRIVKALASSGDLTAPVGDIASPAVAIQTEDSLASALAAMKRHKLSLLPVINGTRLVGSIAKADIRKVLQIDAETPGPLLLDIAGPEVTGDLAGYLSTAASAVHCTRLAMLASGKHSVSRILDYGCGRGRVMRLFKATFPEAELVACDRNASGVDFCAKTFGATPVYATEDPRETPLEGKFDLIWCGSLVTHLDAPRWATFIELFRSLLHSDGLLLFTSHGHLIARKLETKARLFGLSDEHVEKILLGYKREGFGYVDYEPDSGYGFSVASPAWVCARLDEIGGLRVAMYMEQGWAEQHDVVACVLR